MDGVLRAEWSGEVAWSIVSFALPAGVHTLAWAYEKNGALAAGSDADLVLLTADGNVVHTMVGGRILKD